MIQSWHILCTGNNMRSACKLLELGRNEINNKRQMDRLEEDYRNERISRREYEERKRQIEHGSIIY
jgi:hypothetical protein